MRVLAIDTALGVCTAAYGEERLLAVCDEVMSRGHQERIGGLVREVMIDAGRTFGDLERIGVTIGPGSFTGLRIGLSFALGLGAALDIPVVGIPTLHALATSAGGWGGPLTAVIDGRRGQVYRQRFMDHQPVDPPAALDVEGARAEADIGPGRFIGDGALLIAPEGSEVRMVTAPAAAALVRLTETLDPDEFPPKPLYLRAPDATPPTRLPGQARPAVSGA
jgi:tRNA threonylcarbamoyladenosine biosynthesis protein TsaB